MIEVFFSFPDLSRSKLEALRQLYASDVRVNVLISYTTLRWKPVTLERLKEARSYLGEVMLDSGAYHIFSGAISYEEMASYLSDYSELSSKLLDRGIVDYAVAPDVPGDRARTLENTLRFMNGDQGGKMSVLQGRSVGEFLDFLTELSSRGLITDPLGMGNVNIFKGRGRVGMGQLAAVLRAVKSVHDERIHLFGANLRILSLREVRELLDMCDTASWLYDIRFRRRTVLKAGDTAEATRKAIIYFLERLSRL